MIIENATIVDTVPVEVISGASILYILLIMLLSAIFLILITHVFHKASDKGLDVIILSSAVVVLFLIVTLGVILHEESDNLETYMEYVVIFEEDINMVYVYENYEILDYDGLFYTIKEKEK